MTSQKVYQLMEDIYQEFGSQHLHCSKDSKRLCQYLSKFISELFTQVSSNGFFSIWGSPLTFSPSLISSSYRVISPYGADTDQTIAGRVQYTLFTSSDPQMNTVSEFFRSQHSNYFLGTKMMIAQWDRIASSRGSLVSIK